MIVVALLALLMGLSLGMVAGGGSILAVPLLHHVCNLPLQQALATSLVIVASASLVAGISFAKRGFVDFRCVWILVATSAVTAFGTSLLSSCFDDRLILFAFVGMMLMTGFGMLRDRLERHEDSEGVPPVLQRSRILAWGVLIGGVTGIVGVGGGVLITPILHLFCRLPLRTSIGTSLWIITANSVAGVFGRLSFVSVDAPSLLSVGVPAVTGCLLGVCWGQRFSSRVLRRVVGWIVMATAGLMMAVEFWHI